MPKVTVTSPYDESPIETLEMHDEAHAMAVMDRCQQLYLERGRWLSKERRIEVLEKAMTLIAARAEDLAVQAAREGGKPLVDSRVEIQRGIDGIKVAIHEISSMGGREIPMGHTASSVQRMAFTHREPRGVVLAISAFNHPFNLIVHQVVPAIASGCPVIVKPALTTPLSCRSLVGILHEAGLPPDWCQMVLTDNDATGKLLRDPRMAFLTFIGSAPVGWWLRSQLPAGAMCALEHGGVAPVIVDETAELDSAIPALVKGGFYHAGQVCVSVQRIYVHESIAPTFTERFVSAARKLRVGDPTEASTDVGPLILPKEVDRVHAWVTSAIAGGGKLLCGGEKLSSTTYPPTVVANPPADCELSQKEVFGPVVVINAYRDVDEAVALANGPDVFFQAAVFTKRLDTALDLGRRLNGMAVMVNDHTAFRVDWMPFGGHRQSGLGMGGIGYSMHEMTLERMIVFKSPVL